MTCRFSIHYRALASAGWPGIPMWNLRSYVGIKAFWHTTPLSMCMNTVLLEIFPCLLVSLTVQSELYGSEYLYYIEIKQIVCMRIGQI